MKAGYKRDGDAYLLAVIFNERIYSHSELRKLFEEDQIVATWPKHTGRSPFSDLEDIYQSNLKIINPQIDNVVKPPSPMVVLGYTWRVLINIFYIAVVLYVFDKLQGRSEAIITVAVLGLIYVTIRSIAIGLGMGITNFFKVIEADLIRLRELVRDEHVRHRWEDSKAHSEVLSREHNKAFIESFFLFIVSIICLFALESPAASDTAQHALIVRRPTLD
jgi:hypothetical protein